MIVDKTWCMPSKATFSIKPIREIVERVCKGKRKIVDPFANSSKYGTITNDLNPAFDTMYHMDALAFLRVLDDEVADVVLYDPPYSVAQAKICYDSFGKEKLEINVANSLYWANCKKEVARILKKGGVVMCCGWNSNGIGKGLGMEMTEIHLIAHGGIHNDTIVTIEKKL